MDEARVVLERIRRIEALWRERAGPRALLAEVDELVVEASTGSLLRAATTGQPPLWTASVAR
jgi:hypothetical protein